MHQGAATPAPSPPGSPPGPLCSTCYRKHPASFQPCTECGTTERLYHHGLCTRCACRQHLLSLLSHDQGGLHPHAEAIYHVLAASNPAPLMKWLTRGSAARDILAEISQASQPPGHAALDRYPPSRAARHLRKILVAGGILPARDERLAELERWAAQKTGQIEDPAERRIVRSFATWHHLRRLRRESQRHHITAEQADYVHNEIRAAVKLITWLRDNGTSLAACTQRDIDTWLAGGPGTYYHARAFVPGPPDAATPAAWTFPSAPAASTLTQIEDDHRWALVRSLLHDDSHAIEDRVAGLLVLLYGQPLARIARLTRDQITAAPGRVTAAPRHHPPGPARTPRTSSSASSSTARHGHAAVARTERPPVGLPRRSTRTADLHRPPQGPARVAGHPRPLRAQHRPHGPGRQGPPGRARPPARHPHQHRRSLGRTSRRLKAAYAAQVSRRRTFSTF